MSKQFIHFTSGWIPVLMLSLLALSVFATRPDASDMPEIGSSVAKHSVHRWLVPVQTEIHTISVPKLRRLVRAHIE